MKTCAAVVLLCLAASAATAAECESPSRLRFSQIPQGAVGKEALALKPLFDDLEKALGIPVEVVMPSSYGAVVEGLLAGAIDIARLGPATYVSARRSDASITPFASYARKHGAFNEESALYHSVLIVRRDSGMTGIDALRQRKLALVDPDSTSGALIPRQGFTRMTGVALERYFSRIVFAGTHEQSVLAVARGQADAAFVASSSLSTMVEKGAIKPDDFRELWRSGPIPRDPFVYRGQLCGPIKEKIRAVFLRQGGKSNPLLLHNLNAVRFVPIGDRDYQIVRDLP